MRALSTSLALCLGSLTAHASAQSPAAQPSLTKEQALELVQKAGFSIQNGKIVNRCGGASNPRIAFVDLNADGKAEAHVADVDPKCYGKPGAYFAVMSQDTSGNWARLIGEDGIVHFEAKRTNGWNDLSLDPKYSACPGTRTFNGSDYGQATTCAAKVVAASSAAPPAVAAGSAGGAVSQKHLFNPDQEQTPEAKALPLAERNTIFAAAGVRDAGGGRWTGCVEDDSGHSEAQIIMVRDINGDGRKEALIYDSGTFCNGFTGVSSTVLTQSANGAWRVMGNSQGFFNFVESRGTDNFPDIEVGVPGFCFPYRRWNGSDYALIAFLNEEGKPCSPN